MMRFAQVKEQIRIGILVCLLIAGGYVPSLAESLQVGFFTIEPHTMVKGQGAYTGAAIDYFSRLADRMGVSSVTFLELPLARLVASLEREQIDVILFFAKNPQREDMFRYPDTPYHYSQSGLAVNSASPVQAISSVQDLSSLRIGILGQGYLSPMMRHRDIQLEPLYGSAPILRNLKKLLAGHLEAIYAPDVTVIRFEARKYGFGDQVRFVPLPEPPLANYSVFSKKSGQIYLARYEKALKELQKTLPYEAVLEAYIRAAASR